MEQMEMFEELSETLMMPVLLAVLIAREGDTYVTLDDNSIDHMMERIGALEVTRTPQDDGFVITITPPKVEVQA